MRLKSAYSVEELDFGDGCLAPRVAYLVVARRRWRFGRVLRFSLRGHVRSFLTLLRLRRSLEGLGVAISPFAAGSELPLPR